MTVVSRSEERSRTEETYRCPSCGGTLAYKQQSWQCLDCQFGPKHGAD